MRARVYWESREVSGSFEMTDVSYSFEAWCAMVGDKSDRSNGNAYMVGSKVSIPFSRIVRIEKLED